MQIELIAQGISAANEANQRGDHKTAIRRCREVLAVTAEIPEAWYHLGIAQAATGQQRAALRSLEKAQSLVSGSADALNSIGLLLIEMGALDEAERCLSRAISLAPNHPFAHSNMGMLRERQKRYTDAELSFKAALHLRPDLAPIHTNLGGILNAQHKHEEAEAVCRKAIELDDRSAEAWSNLAVALSGRAHYQAAEATCRRAIELAPRSSKAWSNLAAALAGLGRNAEAEAACREAVELDPHSAEAWSNLTAALSAMNRYQAAEIAGRKATKLDPGLARAWNNLAGALSGLHRHEEAAKCLEKCLKLDPAAEFVLGDLLHARMMNCDWDVFDDRVATLEQDITLRQKIFNPFPLLALTPNAEIQRTAAETYATREFPESHNLGPFSFDPQQPFINIGYFSADFRDHAVMYLMARLFEIHDRDRFRIHAFSFGPDTDDRMHTRLIEGVDYFHDVRALGDREIAELARQNRIDIAVDLAGHTKNGRTGIFAHRAAPIQVNYLGYPGTMGAPYIDYIIADRLLVPESCRGHYTENIAYLPDCFQVNDPKRIISEREFTRVELGLPAAGFVFCCFNNAYKITPATFDSWMRILRQVEGSVLFLYAEHDTAKANLRQAARKRGVVPDRIVFGGRIPAEEYLARYRAADLFLDTLPFNGGTTVSDALWSGLPVLTRPGKSYAGRMAASLLKAINLPDLIMETPEEYEELAMALATKPEQLAEIRTRLDHNIKTAPLFDCERFARNLENAYIQMHNRRQMDPCDIVVAAPD